MDSAKLFFRENPFPASPSSDRYLAIGSVEVARKRLMDAIDRRECPGMLVGPPGTGKSLLCTLIAGAYRNEFDVVLLAESRLCTRKALLQHLLHHLGMPYSDKTEGELRLSLIDRAASGGPASRAGLLIVVDEAHTLPGRLLEELRMMSGIVRNGSPRVQLVLAGGPSLDERFAHPRMEAFSQRISTRCYLHPLGQNETSEYVLGAIRHAGANPQATIDQDALAAVYYAADGIPRLINQTMSRAVALAESESQQRITAEIVQRAWADLQQLPSPIVGAAASQRSSETENDFAVVEFGTLDDEQESDPMAETVDYEIGVTHAAAPRAGGAEQAETEAAASEQADAVVSSVETADSDFAGWGSPEVEPVRWQAAGEDVVEESTLGPAPLEELAVEELAVEMPAAEGAAAEGAGGAEVEPLDASDWRPTVVDFGSWESPVVETAGWEAEIVAAGEEESPIATDVLALFGDGFDEEEPLQLNFGAATAESASEKAQPVQVSRPSEPDTDESRLHREIVSINAEAIRNQSRQDFAELPMDSDIRISDDSDLLVIEDDIEVDTRLEIASPRARVAAKRGAAEVDFQSLFSRMREG